MNEKNALNSYGFENRDFAIDCILIFLVLNAALQFVSHLVWIPPPSLIWLQMFGIGLISPTLRKFLTNSGRCENANTQAVSLAFDPKETEKFHWLDRFHNSLKRVKVF